MVDDVHGYLLQANSQRDLGSGIPAHYIQMCTNYAAMYAIIWSYVCPQVIHTEYLQLSSANSIGARAEDLPKEVRLHGLSEAVCGLSNSVAPVHAITSVWIVSGSPRSIIEEDGLPYRASSSICSRLSCTLAGTSTLRRSTRFRQSDSMT